MNKPKIGLLPLYLALYDKATPEKRPAMEAFYGTIAAEIEQRGVEVLRAPLCRVKSEFVEAVHSFERGGAAAIVTLHLAYSPSLESIDALARTLLPVLVLDTTPADTFGPTQDPAAIMYNHGIHGVQDLCNMLLRRGKAFQIEAGHWRHSDVIDRLLRRLDAARLAHAMHSARVGRIGRAFEGMGDFHVAEETLHATIGMQVVPCPAGALRALVPAAGAQEVADELAADRERYDTTDLDEKVHHRTVRVGLAVRRWLEREKLTAFSVNFLSVDRASGLETVPFLEASKAMARGLGYAGEGDVLTAGLVGALMSVYPETTFTEMFCPNWKEDTVFLSHMGEMNLNLAAERPRLLEKPFPYTDAAEPAVAVGRLRGGKAVFIDLAPLADDRFRLILAPVAMIDVEGEDKMRDSVHGWFRPQSSVADFLAAYSRAGGTHHAALSYGADAETLRAFGELMGWETVVL